MKDGVEMYYYKFLDDMSNAISILTCDQLLKESENRVRIDENEYNDLVEMFSHQNAIWDEMHQNHLQPLLDEINEIRGRVDSSEFLINEQIMKNLEISREDFDLLDVTDSGTTYTIIEDDGSITVRKGED